MISLTLNDASSRYHNLKLDEKSPYLTAFICSFVRNRYIGLPFRAAPEEDMFQKKTDDLFSGMPNGFSIPIDIFIAGFDEHSKEHNVTLDKPCWVCRQASLKLN